MANSTKFNTRVLVPFTAALLAGGAAIASVAAQGVTSHPYPRDLPAALVKQAKVSEPAAAKLALARVPQGHIKAVELENEGGKLIYSYEIKVPGHSGIEEVNIDARTGKVASTEHESPSKEKAEASSEKGAARR